MQYVWYRDIEIYISHFTPLRRGICIYVIDFIIQFFHSKKRKIKEKKRKEKILRMIK
jgi:hypothetical protein